jgi:hypothetical protein
MQHHSIHTGLEIISTTISEIPLCIQHCNFSFSQKLCMIGISEFVIRHYPIKGVVPPVADGAL